MRIIALDYETSHKDPSIGAPVSLGVAIMERGEVKDSIEFLFAPPENRNGDINRVYDIVALSVSKFTYPKILRDGLKHKDVILALREWLIGNEAFDLPIWAYNASFDHAFYSETLFLAGDWAGKWPNRSYKLPPPVLLGGWHCVRELARYKVPDLENYKLDTVAAHFGLSREGAKHGALEDATLAGRLYWELTK